jgi:NAD-dependent protein deacetylase sirtuin 5
LTRCVDLLHSAGHPPENLKTIHGHLFDLKCADYSCQWRERGNMADPLWPVLAPASVDVAPNKTLPLLDPEVPAPEIKPEDIPKCPECKVELQRPDIVWFGESWSDKMSNDIDDWMEDGVDIVLSIGTSEVVSTAPYFIHGAIGNGAAYASVNLDAELPHKVGSMRTGQDFAFGGDATELLPLLFEPLIGKLGPDGGVVEAPAGISE